MQWDRKSWAPICLLRGAGGGRPNHLQFLWGEPGQRVTDPDVRGAAPAAQPLAIGQMGAPLLERASVAIMSGRRRRYKGSASASAAMRAA